MAKARVEKVSSERITTPVFRVSYPCLDEPRGFRGADGEMTNPQYSLMAVWHPAKLKAKEKARWDAMLAEFDRIAREAFKMPFAKLPPNIKRGLRDGLEKPEEVGEDGYFASLSARPKYQPGIVDRNRQAISASEVYAGSWARASVVLYSFDNVGKGIGIGLRNVMKVADGERLDGSVAAEDDFDDVDGELPEIEGAFDADDIPF